MVVMREGVEIFNEISFNISNPVLSAGPYSILLSLPLGYYSQPGALVSQGLLLQLPASTWKTSRKSRKFDLIEKHVNIPIFTCRRKFNMQKRKQSGIKLLSGTLTVTLTNKIPAMTD